MKKYSLLIFIILLISCRKENFVIENLNGNKIIALGHGGMGLNNSYPMNSAESILQCLNNGMNGSEMDVQMTADSVLVLYHDEDLSEQTNLKGMINSLKWEEIKNARYNKTLYLNYSIISLDQFFSGIQHLTKYNFTFDCKYFTANQNKQAFYDTFIRATIRLLQKYRMEDNVFIESAKLEFLKSFKNVKSNYRFFINPFSFEEGLEVAKNAGLFGITISSTNISKEQVAIAHENNLWITVWDCHSDNDNKEAIRKNPDCIQTDNVKSLRKLLR